AGSSRSPSPSRSAPPRTPARAPPRSPSAAPLSGAGADRRTSHPPPRNEGHRMTDTTQLPVRPQNVAELEALIGQTIGPTQWHDVTQDSVNAFADVTGDHQWIHVDPERAAESPLGTTIAHGLYSLSLGPAFSY